MTHNSPPPCPPARGKIIKGLGGLYRVLCGSAVYAASAAGVLRKKKQTPVVGDVCDFKIINESEKTAVITRIHRRENELARPRVSNVDLVIVVSSLKAPAFNLRLLSNYLVTVEGGGFGIAVLLNKTDLCPPGAGAAEKTLFEAIGYKTFLFSCAAQSGAGELSGFIQGKTAAFAGASGVGKSSVINALVCENIRRTGAVGKKIARGRHTTREVELIPACGGFVCDTPGFSRVDLNNINRRDLAERFPEMHQFSGKCAFRDCAHLNEPGCAVKSAVGGAVSRARYECYIDILSALRT